MEDYNKIFMRHLQWLTASGTWFGEILVCCCLTGLAWLCLGFHQTTYQKPCAIDKKLGKDPLLMVQ